MSIHIVSSIEAADFGAQCLRVGDLNGDGAPDLLFVQCQYGPRTITCLTATTVLGQKLWQVGKPDPANGRIYGDLPAQVYDWDNDGENEVLYVEQAEYLEPIEYGEDKIREQARRYGDHATMRVLEGKTGRLKTSFAIPAPADDSFAFADLTGSGRRADLVVKDRYWNMWGVAHSGKMLWQYTGSVGHYPAVADVDGDGMDEVFIGYALIDQDGKVLFDHHLDSDANTHSDANSIARLPDGEWRLLFGNGGVHCLAVDGRELWHHPLTEAQHVVAARYRTDTPLQVAVIDRGFPRTPEGRPADLYLYDLATGKEFWRRPQPKGCWASECLEIRWRGLDDCQDMLVSRGMNEPDAVYAGDGSVVDEMSMPEHYCSSYRDPLLMVDNPGDHILQHADVWGDSREEVFQIGSKGTQIVANARAPFIPAQYNNTAYTGM